MSAENHHERTSLAQLDEVADARLAKLRVAIVHCWFVKPWGGAERVVEAIARIFPQADIFAVMADPAVLPPDLKRRKIKTSFIQHVPGKYKFRRQLMPLFPIALEQLDLSDYDLVISSESAPAKGVLTTAHTCHICYCNSPMRYFWDMYHDYKKIIGGKFSRTGFAISAHYLRMWDLATANRVDHFIANSHNVANRIRKHYRRQATVMHCPTDVSRGYLASSFDDYYLAVGRLVDYKRMDLAILACNSLKRNLRIIGDGPEYQSLRRIAGNTVEFLGAISDAELREQYAHCRALLFPGEEDFGLVPVEAQSFGRPVICYGRGGALETVRGLWPGDRFLDGATGVFFPHLCVDSLTEAMLHFESLERNFSPTAIRENAYTFDESHFASSFREFVRSKLFPSMQVLESALEATTSETVGSR